MSKLTLDPLSARSLPKLDELFMRDRERLTELIMTTPEEPLKRLLTAALSRHSKTYPVDSPELSEVDRLLEVIIHNNLLSEEGDDNEEQVSLILNTMGATAQRLMLSASLTRFNTYDARED